MVDALVSGASAVRRAGSSPVLGTDKSRNPLIFKGCGISLLIFVPRLSPKIIFTEFLSTLTLKFFLKFHLLTSTPAKKRDLSASPKIGLIKSGQKSVNLQSDEKREI